ncbi:glycosyltransferase family 39 protein [Patescibacteria group bacterium]|nr:glycosyltransferase family 39 protein [Patescibacteria group bacterium]
MDKKTLFIGFLIALFFLCIHLVAINDYGLTWDFHFHFFGGGHFLGLSWQDLDPRPLPYVAPDPRNAWTLPYGPLMSIPPVLSFLYLFRAWHILPFDSAYNLPIILWGVAGIGILYFFLAEAVNRRVAILGALFLALTPRYFGDLHNNMKDIPSAVIFALNIWLLWRLVRYRRVRDFIPAVLGFALAFNIKVNAIFIPVVYAAWLILLQIAKPNAQIPVKFKKPNANHTSFFSFIMLSLSRARSAGWRTGFGFFLLAPVAAFALWALFWQHPVREVVQLYRTFSVSTDNLEVLLHGRWYCSGSTVPWYYPYWYLAVTTPLPVLFFSSLGVITFIRAIVSRASMWFRSIVTALAKNTGKQNSVPDLDDTRTPHTDQSANLLILLWFFLPLTRYFIPTIGVIDGIRHFEEVLFPIAALAAIGADFCFQQCNNVTIKQFSVKAKTMAEVFITVILLAFLSFQILSYHPYEVTYFNELVGGVQGAYGKYDLDYWGTSQKAAVNWVNTHAPEHATVDIVMMPDVGALYLRPDLLKTVNTLGYGSDFVVILNRQSFYYRFFHAFDYLLTHRPSYTVSVRGTPLTWVFDNRTDNVIPRKTPWWHGEDPCIVPYWKGAK